MTKVFTVGEKVYSQGRSGVARTIELIDGDHAVLSGGRIVKLADLTSVAYVQSEGWYTFDNLRNMAYYITFDAYTKDPKLVWALDLNTQKIDLSPHPQTFNPLTVFEGNEFKPVKLIAQGI